MANTLAPYKQPDILEAVQAWWDGLDKNDYTTIPATYFDYVTVQLMHNELDTIISMNDFIKCLYKLGIRRISTTPQADNQQFVQAENWRPSDTQVMRLATGEWPWA